MSLTKMLTQVTSAFIPEMPSSSVSPTLSYKNIITREIGITQGLSQPPLAKQAAVYPLLAFCLSGCKANWQMV